MATTRPSDRPEYQDRVKRSARLQTQLHALLDTLQEQRSTSQVAPIVASASWTFGEPVYDSIVFMSLALMDSTNAYKGAHANPQFTDRSRDRCARTIDEVLAWSEQEYHIVAVECKDDMYLGLWLRVITGRFAPPQSVANATALVPHPPVGALKRWWDVQVLCTEVRRKQTLFTKFPSTPTEGKKTKDKEKDKEKTKDKGKEKAGGAGDDADKPEKHSDLYGKENQGDSLRPLPNGETGNKAKTPDLQARVRPAYDPEGLSSVLQTRRRRHDNPELRAFHQAIPLPEVAPISLDAPVLQEVRNIGVSVSLTDPVSASDQSSLLAALRRLARSIEPSHV